MKPHVHSAPLDHHPIVLAWSWSVRSPRPRRTLLASGTDTSQDAAQEAAAIALATQLVLAGVLRDDGEPMSGYGDVDNDNTAPSNVTG